MCKGELEHVESLLKRLETDVRARLDDQARDVGYTKSGLELAWMAIENLKGRLKALEKTMPREPPACNHRKAPVASRLGGRKKRP
jgi:hypothetical protein